MLLGSNLWYETWSSSMTQRQCTKWLNGQRGTTACISQSYIWQCQAQPSQGLVIHLATASSCGSAVTLAQSLSSQQASSIPGSNSRAISNCKVIPSSNNTTRMHKNTLVSAISVNSQGTRYQSVVRSLEKWMQRVISLGARLRKLSLDIHRDHIIIIIIIREMNAWATDEASNYGLPGYFGFEKPKTWWLTGTHWSMAAQATTCFSIAYTCSPYQAQE